MANPLAERYLYVQTGGVWNEDTDLAAVSWADRDDGSCLPVEVNRNGGPEPDTLTLRVEASPEFASGRVHQAAALTTYSTRHSDGTDSALPVPAVDNAAAGYALRPFELVRLMDAASSSAGDKAAASVRFVGLVTGYEPHLGPEDEYCTVIVSEIARWHMRRIAVYGVDLARHETAGPDQFQTQMDGLPVFNERGQPDQYTIDAGPTKTMYFCPPNLNSENGAQKVAGSDYATWWSLGDVLNYLRAAYGLATGIGGGTGLAYNYINWSQAAAAGTWDFLFDDATGGNDNRAVDFALGGMSLAEAVDTVVRKAGCYEWCCTWNTGSSKYDLEIYNAISGNGTTHNWSRGSLGAGVGASPPEVIGADLSYSWDHARNSVKAVGARKRYEFSVDTDSASGFDGLEEGWTSAQETAYEAAGAADQNSTRYPSVFQRYVFKKNVDWATLFGTDASPAGSHLDGAREPLPTLLSSVFQSTENGALTPVRLRALAWRYKDGAWEAAPDSVSVQLLPEGGVLVSGRAKNEKHRWGWDGSSTTHKVRVTVSVESDERLSTATSPLEAAGNAAPGSHWPTLRRCLDAGPRYSYEARRDAYLPVDGSGAVVLDNPTSYATKGDAAPEVVRSDDDELEAEAQRTLDALARPTVHGTIDLPVLDWSVKPGNRVGTLSGGGSRPALTLNAVIGEVRFGGLDGAPRAMAVVVGGDTV